MDRIRPFDAQRLMSIAKILGETTSGLTGPEIGYLLQDSRIEDVDPANTKWKRLFNAFVNNQNAKKYGNHIVMFITRALNPVSYTGKPAVFNARREQLNAVLLFCGMSVGDDGKMHRVTPATNLGDALARASRLHAALESRQVHDDVLTLCRAELLQSNYFHAVFEALKSIAAKIRLMSGLAVLSSEQAKHLTQAEFVYREPETRMTVRVQTCDNCGHLEFFHFPMGDVPRAWKSQAATRDGGDPRVGVSLRRPAQRYHYNSCGFRLGIRTRVTAQTALVATASTESSTPLEPSCLEFVVN
jgi:hypothetical protein